MTPLSLGIFASANQSAAATSFESIATVTVGSGGSSTISFTSIPSTYAHLQIRHLARSTKTSGVGDMEIRLNGSTSNGGTHYIYGDGSSAYGVGYTAYTPFISYFPTTGTTASVFNAGVIDILDYKDTNRYKTVRTLTGFDANGSGYISFLSNLYLSTTAVSSIDFVMKNGDFAQYSHFALYGIKEAA